MENLHYLLNRFFQSILSPLAQDSGLQSRGFCRRRRWLCGRQKRSHFTSRQTNYFRKNCIDVFDLDLTRMIEWCFNSVHRWSVRQARSYSHAKTTSESRQAHTYWQSSLRSCLPAVFPLTLPNQHALGSEAWVEFNGGHFLQSNFLLGTSSTQVENSYRHKEVD